MDPTDAPIAAPADPAPLEAPADDVPPTEAPPPAETPPAETPPVEAPPAPAGTEPTPPPAPLPPSELLFRARERGRHGDFAGARILAEEALAVPGDHAREARYVRAFALEFEGDLARALGEWDALEAEADDDDVTFRRAETLGKLGRVHEAREELARLPRDLGDADATKVAALRWIWTLEDGNPKRALKALRALVDAPPSSEPTWHLGLARLALLETSLAGADAIVFEGSDHARKGQITRRAALMLTAENELADLIRLEEPKLALDGFLAVAGGYRALGEDLRAEAPPRGLDARQLEVYRDVMEDQVRKVWAKGALYANKGLGYAAREDWIGPPVDALTASRDALQGLVDASLAAEPPPE